MVLISCEWIPHRETCLESTSSIAVYLNASKARLCHPLTNIYLFNVFILILIFYVTQARLSLHSHTECKMAFADFLCLEEIIPADKSSIGSSEGES